MEPEGKDRATERREIDENAVNGTSATLSDIAGHTEEAAKTETDTCTETPCRIILTGVFTAAILAVIAVLVGGIFQITSSWLTACPHDLPVNDPAPVLWQHMTSSQPAPASTGVPAAIALQAQFKWGNPASDRAKEEQN